MSATIRLAYGGQKIALNCQSEVDRYTIKDPVAVVTPGNFRAQLEAFLQAAVPDLSRTAVVVADKTRLCGYPRYLPVLLDTLAAHGAGEIKLFIAYGTHMPQSNEDSRKAYGACFDQYQWVHHRCEGDHFVELGRTPGGIPVRLRGDIVDASCLVTFGAISHHYFAGYGGGRKLIFPGLGEKSAIYANHGLFLDRTARVLAPACRPGRVAGNPLAEELDAYESFRPADLAVHGILNSHGELCELLVGQGEAHFRTACARHAAHCEVHTERQYDLVLASGGGFPKDINFIQSHKAMHNAAAFVRDGGRLIMAAECRDGVGSETFLPWFELGNWDAAFDALAERYVGNGGTALAMMAKLRRIRIGMVTVLPPAVAETIGIECLSVDQVQACIDAHQGPVAEIPNAAMLVKQAEGV